MEPLTPLNAFLWAFVGSLLREVAEFYQALQTTPLKTPDKYRSPAHWVLLVCLGCSAGTIAVALHLDHAHFALALGAAVPLVLMSMRH